MSKEKCVEGKVYMCWQSMIPGGGQLTKIIFFLLSGRLHKKKSLLVLEMYIQEASLAAHLVTAHSLIRNSAVWEGGESDWLL